MNHSIIKTGLANILCFSLTTATAGTLNITNDPLFIADAVAPGIFFMMDDSGSMDWEVLTSEYYLYPSYFKKNSWGGISGSETRNGLYHAFSTGGDCTGWRDFAYVYDNADNLYGCGYATAEDNSNVYQRDWRILSSDLNVMFYDPTQSYKPWVAKTDDSSNSSAVVFPDANFNSVRSNPQPGKTGSGAGGGYDDLKDLDGFVYEIANVNSFGFCGNDPDGPEGASVHNRCATDSDCGGVLTCKTDLVDLWDTHTRVTVSGSTVTQETYVYNPPATGDSDCVDDDDDPTDTAINNCLNRTQSGATVTITDPVVVASIKQNIANWYQYNRKRSLVAKSAVASVIDSAPFYRFGFGTLHDEFFLPLPSSSVTDYILSNQDLFHEFADWTWQGQGTPLRDGLKLAGEYFKGDLSGDKPIVHACQQNFTILFTDGYYNGSVSGFGDNDGDGISSSLADIAFYYYNTDLDVYNDIVPTTTFDTQDQQHMVTFSVAFGVTGNLIDTDGDGWPNPLPDDSSTKWYNGSSINSNSERIDDMWHAAYNSKGAYISAKTPAQLVQGLNDALSSIQERVGSASSAAASTGASVLTETNVFFAFFDSNDWSGDLYAYDIATNVNTQVSSFDNSVKASTNFYSNSRSFFYSWDPDANSAISFEWALLNSTQQEFLNDNPDTVTIDNDSWGENRVAFIRGVTTYDGLDYTFDSETRTVRDRGGKTMGDILNSAPQFVGGTQDDNGRALAFINGDFSESSSYVAFQNANVDRTHMIYVGANDGMLHGLVVDSDPSTNKANTTSDTLSYLNDYGKEAFAYVPSAVIKRLNKLTSSEYIKRGIATHRYLVDGSPRIEDAYVDGDWKTVLVSGLGAGGQGIFALDVTDGENTASSNAVLWEFNDSDDADLGYTYSRPIISRLQDGNWYAIFGNGYNNTETNNMDSVSDTAVSDTGHAVLFIVKLSGPTGSGNQWLLGTDYYKIDTGSGNVSSPNGLSTASTLDFDRDQVVDAIYAGDIEGNLWRFDLLDGDSNINSGSFASGPPEAVAYNSKFQVAYRDSDGDPMPVFTTENNQPITSAPVIASHPIDGFMVVFGTGQYIESGDNQTTGMPTQSFYGIWDNCIVNHKIGSGNKTQIKFGGTNIPGSPADCTTIERSTLLQQSIVKEEIEVFSEKVEVTSDANGDATIDGSDATTDIDGDGDIDNDDVVTGSSIIVDKNTEEVRITTGYRLHISDTVKSPINTQNTLSGTDQYDNSVSFFSYESETGWLNFDQDEIVKRGWYLDMTFNSNNKSERNTNKPLLLSGTIFFNTYMPSNSSSCGASGDTWIYSLNANDGRQLSTSAFDLNSDGSIDSQDEFNQVEVIGARKKEGYTPGGTIINAGRDKHSITFGGDINNNDDDIDDIYFKIQEGRQTWRVVK